MISASKKEFIEFMMSADVLRFGEFKTKSGRLSPYFVNTGNYKTGAQISTLGKFYAQCIMEHCGENFDAMFGPAYKGIPLATSAAGALAREYNVDKPYFFNRKEAKRPRSCRTVFLLSPGLHVSESCNVPRHSGIPDNLLTEMKAATWLAISQKTATASSSSRTLSPLEPQFVKPFRFCRTLQK